MTSNFNIYYTVYNVIINIAKNGESVYTTLSNARSQSEKFRESITPLNTVSEDIKPVYNDIYQLNKKFSV